ncbi:hypothetical protein OL548_11735 [Lysinibacillus sp. MHQ-1]|nr:hypothetical protein OL548_11735 [Lysinibacillus sp. MHQ-1]
MEEINHTYTVHGELLKKTCIQ